MIEAITQARPRLLLADDHQELLDEVRSLLITDFDVVGTVNDGRSLVRVAEELRPDAVITDVRMPHLNGLEASREILRKGSCQSILLLSMFHQKELVSDALRLGVLGFVLKLNASDELIPAINAVLNGDSYLSRDIRKLAM
jgi:DNA-binding NarL/FixJ family response regulator